MKKITIFMLFAVMSITSFAKITIKISEPIRFKHVNISGMSRDIIVGEGTLEVLAEDADVGKKLTFVFPEYGLMTNMKRWVKIKKYEMVNKKFEVVKRNDVVKFYAVLDRRNLDKGENPDVIEGEYIGYVPIIVRQFSKKIE